MSKGQLRDAARTWVSGGASSQLLCAAAVKAAGLHAAKDFWSFCSAHKAALLAPSASLMQLADVVDPVAPVLDDDCADAHVSNTDSTPSCQHFRPIGVRTPFFFSRTHSSYNASPLLSHSAAAPAEAPKRSSIRDRFLLLRLLMLFLSR